MSEARGIFQGDAIIQTAIRQGFKDLRANPWLLDYLMQHLLEDEIFLREYGQKYIDEGKKWLLKTEVPVIFNARLEDLKYPCVTINLLESAESDNTLGDIHHDTSEPVSDTDAWPALCDPFVPVKWNSATGELVLPKEITAKTYVYPGMNVVDKFGNLHEVLDVREDDGRYTLSLKPGTITDFYGAVIKSGMPPMLMTLESAVFRESYLIGAHVNGDAWQLPVLHSALVFLLLWGRELLLERRGFHVSSISSSDFSKSQIIEPEIAWSRYTTLGGKVEYVWPKRRVTTYQGVELGLQIAGAKTLPPDTKPQSALWMGDEDSLLAGMKGK